MSNIFENMDLETEGNEVSTSFQRDKDRAVRCWQETVTASGLDDKVLASEVGMTKGYYSKVANGEQGDLLGLVYRLPKERAAMRADFFARLAEVERIDVVTLAAETLVAAAIRFLKVRGDMASAPMRMAKAGVAPVQQVRRA